MLQEEWSTYETHTVLKVDAKTQPTKVYIWPGISKKGPNQMCMFEGIMKAPLYTRILEEALLPFIEHHLLHGHRLVANNAIMI